MAKFERQLNARASELVRFVDEAVIDGMQAELIDMAVQRVSGMRICLWCLKLPRGNASLQLIGSDSGVATVTAISQDAAFVDGVEALLDDFQPQR